MKISANCRQNCRHSMSEWVRPHENVSRFLSVYASFEEVRAAGFEPARISPAVFKFSNLCSYTFAAVLISA